MPQTNTNKDQNGRKNFECDSIFAANGPFSHAVSVPADGRLVFTSTVAAINQSWEVIEPGNFEQQLEIVINYLEAVLKDSGASLQDVIKVNWYLTDISFFHKSLEVRKRMFGDNEPASATIPILPLALPGLMIEADAIAWLPNS